MENKNIRVEIQAAWDKCLYVGWSDFLTLGRCHEIFISVLSSHHSIKGVELEDIGIKYKLKRYFGKNKGSDALFIPYGKQAARAVICERMKWFRNLMPVPMEELTLEGFMYYLHTNKWVRYTNHYDAEITKQRNKTKACGAYRRISLRGLSSSGFESAK